MQAYSDPRRESDPHALPDVEIWQDDVVRLECPCGGCEIPGRSEVYAPNYSANSGKVFCPFCERWQAEPVMTGRREWFWWSRLAGYLPNGDPVGPFETEAEALADAQSDALESE